MSLVARLTVLAVNQVLGDRAQSLLSFIDGQFGGHASRMDQALHRASDRAWTSLEVASGGESWWDAFTGLLVQADEKELRRQVRAFLDSLPPADLPSATRAKVAGEIRAARQAGMIPGPLPSPAQVRAGVEALACCADQAARARREQDELAGLSAALRPRYPALAGFIDLRPRGGEPLLVSAVRYFFRREVENDPRLAASLAADRAEGMAAAQKAGFDGLFDALTTQGGRLESLLGDVAGLATRTLEAAEETRDDVAAMRAEMRRMAAMLQAVLERQQAPPPAQAPAKSAVAPAAVPAPPTPLPDWMQVRRLLTRVHAQPTLVAEAQQLENAAIAAGFTPGESGLPVYPQGPSDAAPPPQPPASGKPLLSGLFRTAAAEPAKPAEEAPPLASPPAKKRVISSLFDEKK